MFGTVHNVDLVSHSEKVQCSSRHNLNIVYLISEGLKGILSALQKLAGGEVSNVKPFFCPAEIPEPKSLGRTSFRWVLIPCS